MSKHILLVGLPGAGKTTVGRLVAERLGAAFIDPDTIVVRKMQMPITRIFGEFGETKFRELEREAMAGVLAGPASVIAPGGGWVCQPGQLELAKANSLVIYLRTMVVTAAKRSGEDSTRPLLGGEDPVEKIRQLLKEREAFFLRADCEVKADIKTAAQVADEVLDLARTRGGW